MKNIDKITNYLLADSEDVFMLQQPDLKKNGRTKILGPKEDPDLDPLMKTGFDDAAKINKNYKNLLENLGINDWTNSDLINDLVNDLGIIEEEKVESEGTDTFLLRNNSIDNDTKVVILKLRLHHKWSINSIWAKFWITKDQLNALF